MKFKSIIALIIISVVYSCGPKVGKNSNAILAETKNYMSQVDSNENLKTEVTEGALTDAEGFKDIGSFTYTIYYDINTNELFKIKNVEKTESTTTETYYFKDNDLIYLQSNSGNNIKTIYLKKGRVISETNTTSEDQQILLAKGERFQKGFKKSH
ncbi:MAG: hypothetical protein ACSHXF_01630 [Aquaticitalea sp.]